MPAILSSTTRRWSHQIEDARVDFLEILDTKIGLIEEKQSTLRTELIEIRSKPYSHGLNSERELKRYQRAIDEVNHSLETWVHNVERKESEIALKKVNLKRQSEVITKFEQSVQALNEEINFLDVSLNFQMLSKERGEKRLDTLDHIHERIQYLVLLSERKRTHIVPRVHWKRTSQDSERVKCI